MFEVVMAFYRWKIDFERIPGIRMGGDQLLVSAMPAHLAVLNEVNFVGIGNRTESVSNHQVVRLTINLSRRVGPSFLIRNPN